MVAARLGCFLALREPPNPTVATGCFLGPARTTKPCKLYDICDNKLAAKIDLLEVNCEVEDVVVAIDREVEVIGLEHVLDDGLVDVLQEVAREACAHETSLNKESVDEDGLVQKVLDEAVNVILEKVREQGLRMLRLHSSEEDAKCCYCTVAKRMQKTDDSAGTYHCLACGIIRQYVARLAAGSEHSSPHSQLQFWSMEEREGMQISPKREAKLHERK